MGHHRARELLPREPQVVDCCCTLCRDEGHCYDDCPLNPLQIRIADLEMRLLGVIRVHDDLRKENRALQVKIADMTLERSETTKRLTSAIVKESELRLSKEKIADLKRENQILRDLLGNWNIRV